MKLLQFQVNDQLLTECWNMIISIQQGEKQELSERLIYPAWL